MRPERGKGQKTIESIAAAKRRSHLGGDGNHRFEGVFLDLVYGGRLLEKGGVVFADDVQLPAVRRAVDFCLANLGWTVEEEGAEGDVHEWIVLRTGPHEAFLRPFDAFVDF